MTRRFSRFAVALALIAALGLGVRLVSIAVWAPDTPSQIGGDALFYREVAKLIADGKGFTEPYRYLFGGQETVTLADGTTKVVVTPKGHEEPTAGHPPIYPLYLALFAKLGLRTLLEQQIVSALLGTVSVVLAGLLGRSLLSPRVGLIAAGLTAVYANIWISDGLLLSETAALVFVFATTMAGLRFWRSPTMRNGVLLGVVGALAALSRAELVLYTPIIVVVALLRAPVAWRDRFLRAVVTGLVFLAVMAPWIIRNNLVMEERVTLSDGSGTVLVQSNCDETYYGYKLGFWSLECGGSQPHGPNGELLDESQRDVVVRQRGMDYISNHTTRLVTAVVPARIGRMWGFFRPRQTMQFDVDEGRPWFPAWLGFWQYLALLPFAIGGLVVQWRRKQPVLVVGLWAVLATVTAATAFGISRYRIAAEVSIVMFAAIAIDALMRRSMDRLRTDTTPSMDASVGAEP